MAVSTELGEFNSWLSEKLLTINRDTDLDIFVSYITGILETESIKEDQLSSLSELLSELLIDHSETETYKVCEDIIAKWSNTGTNDAHLTAADGRVPAQNHVDLDTRMHEIIVQQTTEAAKLKALQKTPKDNIKDSIIAQYSHVSDGEETDDSVEDGDDKKQATKQLANKHTTSATTVATASGQNDPLVKEREKQARDHAKQESELKKQKDKEDREKQKQKATDRKENEKKRTQKGEKKR